MTEIPDEGRVVGLIGLGQMGGAMCRTLLREGWRVIAWDLARGAVDAAREAGADGAFDPAGVAQRAPTIVTSLPDIDAVRAVAFGERGLVAAGSRDLVVADTSTTSPEDARRIAAELASHGIGFLDAPVSGGVVAAESGQLAIMVGGEPETLERGRDVLNCLGRAVVHCGPAGAGQVAKACNQLVVMSTIEAVAEALVLASSAGLDPWRVREALLLGFAASPILDQHGSRMLRHDFAPGGKAIYHLKDIATIREVAASADLSLPGFAAAARQVERLVTAGGGDLDHSALITVLEADPPPREAVPVEPPTHPPSTAGRPH